MKDEKLQNVVSSFCDLKNNIGKEVEVYYIFDGSAYKEKGILQAVYPFSGLSIDFHYIPFIGHTIIWSIKSSDEILFENKYVFREYKDIKDLKRNFYGDEYVDKTTKRYKNSISIDKRKKNFLELKQQILNNNLKQKLINEGLPLVKEDLKEEWINYVDENIKDGYSRTMLKYILYSLKELEKGTSCEEIDNNIKDVTEFTMENIVRKTAQFSKNGQLFINYWNNKKEIEINKIVNPSVLSLK